MHNKKTHTIEINISVARFGFLYTMHIGGETGQGRAGGKMREGYICIFRLTRSEFVTKRMAVFWSCRLVSSKIFLFYFSFLLVVVVVVVVSLIYLDYARDKCAFNVWQNFDFFFFLLLPTILYMKEKGFNLKCQSLPFYFG